jgi:hypothetical protein
MLGVCPNTFAGAVGPVVIGALDGDLEAIIV